MININCFQKSHRCRPRVENWNDRFVSNGSAEQNFDIFYVKAKEIFEKHPSKSLASTYLTVKNLVRSCYF